MKRMEGFKTAALETPKTMAGLTDQIKEGYTRTSAIATEPLYDYYKEILEDIAELFLNQKTFELNSETVDNIKAFSEHVVNAAKVWVSWVVRLVPLLLPLWKSRYSRRFFSGSY